MLMEKCLLILVPHILLFLLCWNVMVNPCILSHLLTVSTYVGDPVLSDKVYKSCVVT